MRATITTLRSLRWAALLPVMLAAGCTLQSSDAPPLVGPSSTALTLDITATPDVLPEDGVSQSVVLIIARDQHGQPVPNLPLRIDTVVGQTIVDVGTLSARNVTTNANGQASVIFTAPRSLTPGVDSGTTVNIRVVQVGGDFGNTFQRTASIRLVPGSVTFTPGAPVPSFLYSPVNPAVGQPVQFDASDSRDDDGFIVKYTWNYGDGTVEPDRTTPRETHDFVAKGTYFVTLTVTDNQGKTSSLTKSVVVGG